MKKNNSFLCEWNKIFMLLSGVSGKKNKVEVRKVQQLELHVGILCRALLEKRCQGASQ